MVRCSVVMSATEPRSHTVGCLRSRVSGRSFQTEATFAPIRFPTRAVSEAPGNLGLKAFEFDQRCVVRGSGALKPPAK